MLAHTYYKDVLEFAPVYYKKMTLDEKKLYCQFLDHNGHRDWRLPTDDEWDNHPELRSWHRDQNFATLPVIAVRSI